jgi:hypothetical protein
MTSSGPWKGDEVGRKPGGQAEAAAERAEGRSPVPAPDGRQASDQDPSRAHRPQPSPTGDDEENREEKRQAAEEQHADDRAAGTGTAPKNI